MRKIILQLAVSLDSFIEGPNGEFDWCFTDQDYGMGEFLDGVDSIFIGRKSYELLQAMGEHGKASFPPMQYYVFSNTLNNIEKGNILVSGDIAGNINNIKNTPGKNIWLFGGASLTAALIQHKLVDEIALAVHPILLGSGKPLFSGINHRLKLALTASKTYDTGLVFLTYKVMY